MYLSVPLIGRLLALLASALSHLVHPAIFIRIKLSAVTPKSSSFSPPWHSSSSSCTRETHATREVTSQDKMQLVTTVALLSALLVHAGTAAEDTAFVTAAPHAGSATSDAYPPDGSM